MEAHKLKRTGKMPGLFAALILAAVIFLDGGAWAGSPPNEAALKKAIGLRSTAAVLAMKTRNTRMLSTLVHPCKGVRFSPYAYVNPKKDLVFKPAQVTRFFKDTKKYHWGFYDGSGEPIVMTPTQYFQRFVYDRDFANAKEVGYNRSIGQGNTPDNSSTVYPKAIVVEYHFPGFDPKYGGMDWRSLRLVWERLGRAWYLVGVIHAEWTI